MKNIPKLLIICFMVAGCASYRLGEAQSKLRSTFATQNFNNTEHLLKKYARKDIYKSKDQVLYNLELGTVMHFSARYDSSSHYFSRAEQEIDNNFTKSISQGIKSFLFTNDNALAYNGEAYEDIYLNAFKSLNYIHQNDYEGALVEARRMAYKLSQVEAKYRGAAQALSKADTLGRSDWKPGKQNIQNSPLSHYLASVLYASSGKADDARIEYQKLLKALRAMPGQYSPGINEKALQQIKNAEAYNLLLIGFAGRAPIKYQNDVRLYLGDADLYLKFSLPALRLYKSRVHRVDVQIDNGRRITLPLIERMDVVAKEVYKVKEPIIYARTFVRSLVKAVGTNAAGRAVEKKNEGLGLLVNLLGKAGQEFTENADIRSWQTMPGQAYVTIVKLPPGNHKATIEYRNATGQLLYRDTKTVSISPHKNLNLLESLYWN